MAKELNEALSQGKVEKVLQPERDEINLLIRAGGKNHRLIVSASSNNPRLCLTKEVKENPPKAMTLCMLLRKHLGGSKVVSVTQCAFERVIRLSFDAGDEMGYRSAFSLYLEIMGRNSNLIFCDREDKILAAVRTSDLLSPTERKVIPGLVYELPDRQDKSDSHLLSHESLIALFASAPADTPARQFITSRLSGISNLTAGEIVWQCGGFADTVGGCTPERLADAIIKLNSDVENRIISPCLLYKRDADTPFEYSFMKIKQYEGCVELVEFSSVSEVIDEYFGRRDRSERQKQHVNDINIILKNAKTRLTKKINAQRDELAECDKAEEIKRRGDLIMQELYRIKRGDALVTVTDYTREPYESVEIKLDIKLSPSQNAQKCYKDFTKKKTARVKLNEQLALAASELSYIESIADSLSRSLTSAEIDEIREELSAAGYGKASASLRLRDKPKKPKPTEYRSPSGVRVLIGKNNLQNDFVTTVAAGKYDYWFHIKNYPGSHVVLLSGGDEPPAEDFTFCARLAAYNSKARGGENVAVDYTLIKNVKKPAGAKPGFVTYDKYFTAYVDASDPLADTLH